MNNYGHDAMKDGAIKQYGESDESGKLKSGKCC